MLLWMGTIWWRKRVSLLMVYVGGRERRTEGEEEKRHTFESSAIR